MREPWLRVIERQAARAAEADRVLRVLRRDDVPVLAIRRAGREWAVARVTWQGDWHLRQRPTPPWGGGLRLAA